MKTISALALLGLLFVTLANAATPESEWTFTVGVTPMTGLTDFGFRRAPDWKTQARFVVPPLQGSLPAQFDWRGRGIVGPIRDQAAPVYCGSCWAHGTIAALEGAIAMKTGRVPSIAPQQLVSCQPSYGTCGGGDFAFGFYRQVGANYESEFPYEAADIECKEGAPQHEKISDWGYVGSEEREPSIAELKAAIFTYGPIAVTVASSRSWSSYRGGVYNACDSQSINHIVALVGWDDADGTWIVRNSHGTQFGEQGYMRTKQLDRNGQKCNGIGGSAAFAVYTPNTPQFH